jgi:hypothetical protein
MESGPKAPPKMTAGAVAVAAFFVVLVLGAAVGFFLFFPSKGRSPPPSSSVSPPPSQWIETEQTMTGRLTASSSTTEQTSVACRDACKAKGSIFANYDKAKKTCLCYDPSLGSSPLAHCNISGQPNWATWNPGLLPPSQCPKEGMDLSPCGGGTGMQGLPSDQALPFDPSGSPPADSAGCASACQEDQKWTAAAWTVGPDAGKSKCTCYRGWAGQMECWDTKHELKKGETLDFWTKTGQSNCKGGAVPLCPDKPDPGTCSPGSCTCSMGINPSWVCSAKSPGGCNRGFKPYCGDGGCGIFSWGQSCGCDCIPD